MARVVGVIMAGGQGERFWPVSSPDRPKQFLDLNGSGTLVQQTVLRLARIIPLRNIFVVTGERYMALAREQLPQLPAQNFIVEPVGRDTAPCVGLSAVWIEKIDPEATLLVVPADHFIQDEDRFAHLASLAIDFATEQGALVTLGIRPDRPETGYGYVELGEAIQETAKGSVHRARRFVEKPDKQRAEDYVASGRFLWNAGMFAWTVRAIREEIARYLPELHQGLEELAAAVSLPELARLVPQVFPRLPKISIDYGVMERSDRVFVVPSDFQWDDLGSWTAISRLRTPDAEGNVVNGRALIDDCRNVFIQSHGRLVATLGVSDLIVVETDNAVLVCAKDRAQDVRSLAAKARELGGP